jgi:hypothetical protein
MARELDRLGQRLMATLPPTLLMGAIPSRSSLDVASQHALSTRRQMIALQEELDWRCYRLYGLLDEHLEQPGPPAIDLGERAFEIAMARRMADGALETTWFDRHGSKPVTEIPAHWPNSYRTLVERRIALIKNNRWINLIERPEYKRRWQWTPWEEQEKAAIKEWLCNRLEDLSYWGIPPTIRSINQLADHARDDP